MKHNYTGNELKNLDKVQDDLIIWLFDTKDKRYAIKKSLKKAFMLGRKSMKKEGEGEEDGFEETSIN